MGEPTPLICYACKQEVRWGWRHGLLAWWHREDVDHHVVLGVGSSPELLERLNQLNQAKAIEAAKRKGKKRKEEDPEEGEQEAPAEGAPLPEPEVRSTPLNPKDPRVPGGARTILNLLEKEGWELRRLTYSKGPYIGADGKLLSISEFVVLGAVDGAGSSVVAFWRDNKFDGSMAIHKGVLDSRPNSTGLKNWIKGTAA